MTFPDVAISGVKPLKSYRSALMVIFDELELNPVTPDFDPISRSLAFIRMSWMSAAFVDSNVIGPETAKISVVP